MSTSKAGFNEKSEFGDRGASLFFLGFLTTFFKVKIILGGILIIFVID